MLVHRFLHIWPFDHWYLRLLAPTLAGVAAIWATHVAVPTEKWFLNLVASTIIGGLTYAVVLVAIGLKPGERQGVMRIGRKALGRNAEAES
jgi:ABC-type transport system involved in cytochrome bd biosynthesis fused ATPase/permease subunit